MVDALPEGYRQDDLGPQATWLYRTLRAAEMAGLDARDVIHAAVDARDLAGSRNVAAVLDARMRKITGPLVPIPGKPWTDRLRRFADPQIAHYERALRCAMDERAGRLGLHAIETSPDWAVRALGPIPEDFGERLEWIARAARIATYRELYGIDDPHNVIGPEPTGNAPEMRAAWHDAFAAMGRTHTVDVRTLPDKSLEHTRASYRSETGWAPPHVGRQLRDVRLGAETMRMKAIRADAEARGARDQAVAVRHAAAAKQARALEAQHREHEALLSQVMDERNLWDKLSEGGRRLAVQADAELRRRHPEHKIPALQSAEPAVPDQPLAQPGWLADLEEQRRVFREEYEARQNVTAPAEEPDEPALGEAWPGWHRWDGAMLQPPKPEIRPAEPVLQAAHHRQAQYEAELEGV